MDPRQYQGRPEAGGVRRRGVERHLVRREVQQLGELAEQLKSDAAPVDALRRWLRSNIEFVATNKGMSAALAFAVHGSSELYAYTFDRLTKAVGALFNRAVAAGEIRSDIAPEDLLRALVTMCYMHDQPGWQATVLRLMDVFVDGLCAQAGVNTKRRWCRDAATSPRALRRALNGKQAILAILSIIPPFTPGLGTALCSQRSTSHAV
jgi:hypothetical protein